MPIYSKPVRLLFKDMVKELQVGPDSVLTREEVSRWFESKYPKIKPATISAHLSKLSINAPSRVYYGVNLSGDDDLFFQIDGGHYRLYKPLTDPPPIYEKRTEEPVSGAQALDVAEEDRETVDSNEFAYEKDLQSFLSKNLSLVEPGLSLYEEEGITGLEYPAGGRYIDILARDTNSNYVVIELKVSRGYDRVVGQVLRYMAWIGKNLADASQSVRGVIIAREISEDLLLAASLVPNVELYEYQMSVTLRRVVRGKG